MKNTSILIPIILIVCLAALIYLFVTALQRTNEDPFTTPSIERTTLPESRYADEDNGVEDARSANIDDYFEEESSDPQPNATRNPSNRPTDGETEQPQAQPDPAPRATIVPAGDRSTTRTANRARYLVLAGSFRQKLGAEQRVATLRRLGFPNARVGYMDRKSIAVAIADESNSLTDMMAVRDRVQARNIEAMVWDKED